MIECLEAYGRVEVAESVRREGASAVGNVPVAGYVVTERINTVGRVLEAGCVAFECRNTGGRVVVAVTALLDRPVLLLSSAKAPLAVFSLP